MFEDQFVGFTASQGSLSLADATVLIDSAEPPGVHIAARNLVDDFGRVTGRESIPLQAINPTPAAKDTVPKYAIIVGTLESSALIRKLLEDGTTDFSDIRGKWESYATVVVENPPSLPNCEKALVIAGSDKRGAIYGIYSLSEQIGVSPWYWWADVPPKFHPEIYALSGVRTTNGEPSIRYRGIFINDEAPALTGWVLEKYGRYGVEFYAKVFELLLRLKANFMWPAMWPGYPNPGAVFFADDDGANQRLAEEYGIVVSTSHHEPMQRATTEWFFDNPDGSWDWLTNKDKIVKFFEEGAVRAKDCESYFTMGMRGEYDRKMKTDDPAAVVRDVILSQRKIIGNVYGREDGVCQLLALYKEVLEQFETGRLEVADDITLLFADDNHGTIRRLPKGTEAQRKGGAGIYYHLEYVGIPRSYKWINSNSLGKMWHQLQEAHRRSARQIWIFNVGDIKPLEVPLTFAMSLAWNVDSIKSDGFGNFYERMAQREFGGSSLSTQKGKASTVSPDTIHEIASLWHEYDRLASIRKHEMIEPNTFSALHFREAESITARWNATLNRAQRLLDSSSVPSEARPALFELLVHPLKASHIFVALRESQTLNRLHARQRRNTANHRASDVLKLFDEDFDLQEEFHSLLSGRWNHMMRQTHFGYEETWHAPSRDMIEGICYVQRRQNSNPIVGQMGVAVEGHEGVRPGRINEESERTHPSQRDLVPGITFPSLTRYDTGLTGKRWFEIFTRGSQIIHWTASVSPSSSPAVTVKLSKTEGVLHPNDRHDARIEVEIDWEKTTDDSDEGENELVLIDVRSEEGDFEQLRLPTNSRRVPPQLERTGISVEGGGGYVSVPATAASEASLAPYRLLPYMGRELTGSVALGDETDDIPWLTYPIYTFATLPLTTAEVHAKLHLVFSMTLDVDPTNPMTYDLQVDEQPITTHSLIHKPPPGAIDPSAVPAEGWFDAAQDGVWKRCHEVSLVAQGEGGRNGGLHTLRIRLLHTNAVLEKLVLDLGAGGARMEETYLGPPASYHL